MDASTPIYAHLASVTPSAEAKYMNVCMLAYTFYESDNRLRRYSESLVKRHDRVEAIVLRRKGQPEYEVIEGVHVYRIQERQKSERHPLTYLFKLLWFFLNSSWTVLRHHLQTPYDVIHVHSVPDFEVFAALVPKMLGAKVILDIHDLVPELYAGKFNVSRDSFLFRVLVAVERASVRFADHTIIANHLWHKRLIERSARADRCTAILNYPDPAIFHRRPRKPSAPGEFVMFYPGSLTRHQGVDLIIAAMARLKDSQPGLRFLIFGDGNERERILEMTLQYGLEQSVKIMDWQPSEVLAQTMSEIDLGVEPKRKSSFANEALSTKIMEFMIMGVPVIASDTMVHKMYFPADTVDYFESDNVEQLAQRIEGLIQNREKRESLCARASEFMRENTWDVKKGEYWALLDNLVRRPKVGSTREISAASESGALKR